MDSQFRTSEGEPIARFWNPSWELFSVNQAIAFVTAISEYDQFLQEDDSKNRLIEALDLFKEICHHPAFVKTHMMIFLNKNDLFEKKMANKVGDLSDIFPEYDGEDSHNNQNDPKLMTQSLGGHDKAKAMEFIVNKFWGLYNPTVTPSPRNGEPPVSTKDLYFHITCATDKVRSSLVIARM